MRQGRVKLCGFLSLDEANAAHRLGASAIGLNAVPESPRCLAADQIETFTAGLHSEGARRLIGIFVRPTRDQVAMAFRQGLDALQLYEPDLASLAAPLAQSGQPIILAQGVASQVDLETLQRDWFRWRSAGVHVEAVLIDAKVAGRHGGTGQRPPWDMLAAFDAGIPWILAGGLNPDNVAEAIATVKPWAVDVASGVESAPGRKDQAKMAELIQRVETAFEQLPDAPPPLWT